MADSLRRSQAMRKEMAIRSTSDISISLVGTAQRMDDRYQWGKRENDRYPCGPSWWLPVSEKPSSWGDVWVWDERLCLVLPCERRERKCQCGAGHLIVPENCTAHIACRPWSWRKGGDPDKGILRPGDTHLGWTRVASCWASLGKTYVFYKGICLWVAIYPKEPTWIEIRLWLFLTI